MRYIHQYVTSKEMLAKYKYFEVKDLKVNDLKNKSD
jgi:hypothetical protein